MKIHFGTDEAFPSQLMKQATIVGVQDSRGLLGPSRREKVCWEGSVGPIDVRPSAKGQNGNSRL